MYIQNIDFEKMFPEVPECIKDEQRYMDDFAYFKRMYPAKLRLAAGIIEDYLDQFEYEGSPIYVEYPDQVTIYRMANRIYDLYWSRLNKAEEDADTIARFKDIIYIMVCQEIYIRRRRKERYLRRFYAM